MPAHPNVMFTRHGLRAGVRQVNPHRSRNRSSSWAIILQVEVFKDGGWSSLAVTAVGHTPGEIDISVLDKPRFFKGEVVGSTKKYSHGRDSPRGELQKAGPRLHG